MWFLLAIWGLETGCRRKRLHNSLVPAEHQNLSVMKEGFSKCAGQSGGQHTEAEPSAPSKHDARTECYVLSHFCS